MNEKNVTGIVGTILSAVGTATQTNEILETISLIITIIGGVLTFIVMPLISWFKKASEDGKIDIKEIGEAVDVLKDGIDKTKDLTEKEKKNG